MRERLERMRRPRRARDRGSSPSTPRAGACSAARRSGSATRRASRSTTRPTRSASCAPASRISSVDPKRFTPRGIHSADLEREEPADRPGRVHRAASRRSTTRPSPRSTSATRSGSYRSNAVDFDDLLMLTVEVLRALPRGARALAAQRSATSSSTSTRTRTTPSTGCCSCSPAEHGNVLAVGDPDQCLVEGTMITMADGTHQADRGRRRRATRCSRATAAALPPRPRRARAQVAPACGHRDHDRVWSAAGLDARAHALRRASRSD